MLRRGSQCVFINEYGAAEAQGRHWAVSPVLCWLSGWTALRPGHGVDTAGVGRLRTLLGVYRCISQRSQQHSLKESRPIIGLDWTGQGQQHQRASPRLRKCSRAFETFHFLLVHSVTVATNSKVA